MVVSVTASTTQGKNLTKEELDILNNACDMAIDLAENKRKIFEYVFNLHITLIEYNNYVMSRYVESRMNFIAPIISAIIAASIAAKLMGAAGGLTKLSKMPSNNIALSGKKKSIPIVNDTLKKL